MSGMDRQSSVQRALVTLVLRTLLRVVTCDRAAISPLTALMLIPISGAMAYSVELGGWYYMQRSMQNAADSAAIAAATVNNAGTTGTTSLIEARAAANKFGFTNGVNNTTVTAASVTCPTGTTPGATCYRAIVSTVFPLLFSRVIGLNGDTALGTARGQLIQAAAIARTAGAGTGSTNACVWALSNANNAFDSNGGPKPDMSGCSLLSNGGMSCSGHDLGADYGIAAGTSSGCGAHQVSGATMPPDPYAALASNIPSGSCADAPADNSIGNVSLTGNLSYCGNVKLSGDVTLTGTNTVMVIRNGALDLNGYTLKTATGAGATVVFTGTNTSPRSHFPMSSINNAGTIDIQAPTSGTWSGTALYQDPNLTSNVSFTYTGNQPTWNITGLVYLPKADVQFSGAVNKSASGASCFVLVAYTVRVNGTAYIYSDADNCGDAGLTAPSVTVGTTVREKLVS